MTQASRRITITKRVSLADFGEGWDDCYALLVPADRTTYEQIAGLDVAKMSQAEMNIHMMDTVKKHFVKGRIMVWNEGKDDFELADMTAEDIDASLELTSRLYLEVMGLKYDPKGSSGEAANAAKPTSSESTTATTSSTASALPSPETSSGTSTSSATSSDEASPTTTP